VDLSIDDFSMIGQILIDGGTSGLEPSAFDGLDDDEDSDEEHIIQIGQSSSFNADASAPPPAQQQQQAPPGQGAPSAAQPAAARVETPGLGAAVAAATAGLVARVVALEDENSGLRRDLKASREETNASRAQRDADSARSVERAVSERSMGGRVTILWGFKTHLWVFSWRGPHLSAVVRTPTPYPFPSCRRCP